MTKRLEFLEVPERFLPVTPAALVERMLADPRLSRREREQLTLLAEMVSARFHHEFRGRLERLKALYEPFDPDRELAGETLSADARQARRGELGDAVASLLYEGNYVELPPAEVVRCIEFQSQGGLVIKSDLREYDVLRVFYRGVRHETRMLRALHTPWRKTPEPIHVFSRVVALVGQRRNPTGQIHLKLFKNIVAEDLEMLLPSVRICMRWRDRLKIGSSMAGGLATAVWKAFTAAILSPWAFWTLLVALGGASLRGLFSFFSSKAHYMQALASNLYFQNLANSATAITALVDTAEAEEAKEFLLAYFLLYVERDQQYTAEGLDRRIERWLADGFAFRADFDAADAVASLCRKKLVERFDGPAGPVLRAYDLDSALRRMDEAWDNFYFAGDRRAAEDDRLAEPRTPSPAPPADGDGHRRIDAPDVTPAPAATPAPAPERLRVAPGDGLRVFSRKPG